MPDKTLRIWLISKEHRSLPHKLRRHLCPNFEAACPVPNSIYIPGICGKISVTYKRLFAVIQGGEGKGEIIGVYYIEQNA